MVEQAPEVFGLGLNVLGLPASTLGTAEDDGRDKRVRCNEGAMQQSGTAQCESWMVVMRASHR